jgi:integrase
VRVALPRDEQERIVPLTVEQVRALADAVAPRYWAMVMTQAGLGLRIGELLALRVVDVDFLRRTVRVEHQIDPKTRERIPPKTPRSRRTLPLPDVVAEALAQHIATFPPTTDGLIFHTSTDRPYWQEHYGARVLARAVEHARLPAGTTSHDLRHHYASVLLAAGESVVAVAERLGHQDATLVLTTYGHLMPDSEDRTRRAVDEAWNAVSGAPPEAGTARGRPR